MGNKKEKIECLFGFHKMTEYISRSGWSGINYGKRCRICGFEHNTCGIGWGKFTFDVCKPPHPSTLKQKWDWIFKGKIIYEI